ncbi:MAG: sulfatase-like hydrolase/transferase, partial [Candidatus Latescibacteria bacterium]|nr:sulfatase-like hydrolase/transferase [Candidatus Latescibacterota bacterium]
DAEFDRIRALYAGECTLIDTWIGHLFEALTDLGLWDDTIVAFTTDHGTNMGERGHIRKRPWTLESQEARLPLIIRHPDSATAGKRVNALLHAPDLAPTLLALLDHEVPQTMTGSDFWPLVKGDEGELHEEIVTAFGPYAALRNDEWLYTSRYAPPGEMGRAEVFPPRLAHTDAELEDVSADHPEQASRMADRLTELIGGRFET